MQHAEIGSTHMSFCSLKLVTDLETAFGISFKYPSLFYGHDIHTFSILLAQLFSSSLSSIHLVPQHNIHHNIVSDCLVPFPILSAISAFLFAQPQLQ